MAHPGRPTERAKRRMGISNIPPAVHTPGSQRSQVVQRKTTRTTRRPALREGAYAVANRSLGHRKPCQRHIHSNTTARPSHSTVAIRPRRNKGHMPMAQKPAAPHTNKHRRRQTATNTHDAPWTQQSQGTIENLPRHRRSNGRTMGKTPPGTAHTPINDASTYPQRGGTRPPRTPELSTARGHKAPPTGGHTAPQSIIRRS